MNAHLFAPEHQPINEDGHYMMTDANGRFIAVNEKLPWYTCMCGKQFWAKVGDLSVIPVCTQCGYDPHKNSRMPLHLANTTYRRHTAGTGRHSGRSTRLIDDFIQKLFNTGAVEVFDHHGTREASADLFDRFMVRLNSEHGGGFIVDRKKFTVKMPKV